MAGATARNPWYVHVRERHALAGQSAEWSLAIGKYVLANLDEFAD
jgi:hypothetical protein